MREPVDLVFPPVKAGPAPYWRLVLRGCSQLCFQANELTGVFFLAAVLIASPIAFAYLLVAGIMAPAGRMLLGERGPVLATGLPGLNPCLIALSLPVFFHTDWTNVGMWAPSSPASRLPSCWSGCASPSSRFRRWRFRF